MLLLELIDNVFIEHKVYLLEKVQMLLISATVYCSLFYVLF
jgi:hypothetical protein